MAPMNSVLAPGSIEMPTCMCGEEMQLTKVEPHPAAEDAELRATAAEPATTKCA